MARIPPLEPDNEPAELKPVFDQLRATRGRVPGMYRTLAHQPAILAAHRAYFHAALDAGVLPRPFKEKIAWRVARLRGSEYSSASHRRYALKHGVAESELAAIDRGDYLALPPREVVALRFAEAMVRGQGHVDTAIYAALPAHFNPAEIVEIAVLVGIMELASTLGAVFELAPD
ncbi:MAG: carboxymuconolactone decarboxylase family protein [Burkholderiales bacterium]|jgi:alkylhydroperoxidase family enzyme|nr:carboxymuconolactone decarboxylase family protein [Burkholderiales bacterium]